MKRFLVPTAAGTSSSSSSSGTGAKRLRSATATAAGVASASTTTTPCRPRKISNHSDLDVLYYRHFLEDGSIGNLSNLPLEQTSIIMFGKLVKEPRLTGYFGDKPLKYSGSVRHPKVFTDELDNIRKKIEELTEVQLALRKDKSACSASGPPDDRRNNTTADDESDIVNANRHSFNGCLANLYLDGSHYMGFHRDDECENGPSRENRVIASVTLGESRRFVFKRDSDLVKVEINLEPGSLLLMKGRTQSLWKHALPKTSKPVGKRLNLTFRVIV